MDIQHVIGKVESLSCSGSYTTTLNLELLNVVFYMQGALYSHDHLFIHVHNFERKAYTVMGNNSINIDKTYTTSNY